MSPSYYIYTFYIIMYKEFNSNNITENACIYAYWP